MYLNIFYTSSRVLGHWGSLEWPLLILCGKIDSIFRTLTLVPRAQCAFVQYTMRSAAEHAAEKTFNRLVLGGKRLTIKWGKSQGKLQLSIFLLLTDLNS